MIRHFWPVWFIAVLLPLSGYSAETDLRLNLGGYYSTGDYGIDQESLNDDTRISAIPFSLQARQWPWTIKFSSSIVKLEYSASNTHSGPGFKARKRSESGLGDSVFTLNHGWLGLASSNIYSAAWLQIKIPTADEDKDLGSGELDVEPGFTLNKPGTLSLFLKLSYRLRGDSPETNYHHQWKSTTGLSHRLGGHWQLSGLISSKQAATDHGKTNTSLYLSLSHRINRVWGITPYVSYGLSDGSPDYALGWNLSYRFQGLLNR